MTEHNLKDKFINALQENVDPTTDTQPPKKKSYKAIILLPLLVILLLTLGLIRPLVGDHISGHGIQLLSIMTQDQRLKKNSNLSEKRLPSYKTGDITNARLDKP